MKRIAILGSTGSIGRSTLSVAESYPDRFQIVTLAAGSNLDAAFERADARDLGQIGRARDGDALESATAGKGEDLRAFGAGLPEERKRETEILDGQPGLFGEAVRRQIIGVAPRRRLADLDEPLLDAALEVGVDEPEGDTEFGSQTPLRLAAVALDRLEQTQHDALVVLVRPLVLGNTRHLPPTRQRPSYYVHAMNVKPYVHRMNACTSLDTKDFL